MLFRKKGENLPPVFPLQSQIRYMQASSLPRKLHLYDLLQKLLKCPELLCDVVKSLEVDSGIGGAHTQQSVGSGFAARPVQKRGDEFCE
jgi:hypothetical protein